MLYNVGKDDGRDFMRRILNLFICTTLFICLTACENGNANTTQINSETGMQQANVSEQKYTRTPASHEQKELVLIDSGWSTLKESNYTELLYAVQIENPNSDYAIEFPKIIITAKDAEGKILKNEEQVLNSIAAGDIITYGNSILYEGEIASSVEISVSNGKNDYIKQDDNSYVKSSAFSIDNISENKSKFSTKYTGEITNNSNTDFDMVAISVIYRLEGKLVGGSVGYVDNIGADETIPFEISGASYMENYDSFELHAIQW